MTTVASLVTLLMAVQCPVELPLGKAPIDGLDAHTVVLGAFDDSLAMLDAGGSNLVKSTQQVSTGAGIFSTGALVVPAGASVGIYEMPDTFNPEFGTIEMWVKPGAQQAKRRYLFSTRGVHGIDGDDGLDLFVGETTTSTTPFFSRIYHNDGSGLDLANPTLVRTVAPRGVAVGDVNGDDIVDLVIAQNFADTLPSPMTAAPGEVHFYYGPIVKGQTYSVPDQIIEVDKPQGLVLAEFDLVPGLDFVVGSFSNDTAPIFGYANDGAGNFSPMNFAFGPFSASAEGLAVADVNDDGVLDVLYGSFDLNPSSLLLGQINGQQYEIQPAPGQGSARSNQSLGAAMADLDGDGYEDVVLAQTLSGDGRLAVHFNNGSGAFSLTPDCVIPTKRPFTVSAYRDLNNDGYLDIVAANWRDGLNTTVTSTVFYGPIQVPANPTTSPPECVPPSAEFLVDDAVSMAVGDLDGDGIDDLFFHSGTATQSPVFFLTVDGAAKGGFVAGGKYVPSLSIPTQPTKANPAGEGAGAHVAIGGTSTYGSIHERAGSIELYLEGSVVRFEVIDETGAAHVVSAPFPFGAPVDAVNGFVHVQAEWSASAGVVQLRVGTPWVPANVTTVQGAPFSVAAVSRVFRVGSDVDNQRRLAGGMIDDLRISDVRRGNQDADKDGVLDGWDNCRFLANPTQTDTDGDGIGDLCSTCQSDLGMQGPGSLTLAVCGQPLSPGNFSVIQLRCGPAAGAFALFISFQNQPTAAFGGTFVPLPVVAVLFGSLNSDGEWHVTMPSIVGGADLFMQALAIGPLQPGPQLSNAVQVKFLP